VSYPTEYMNAVNNLKALRKSIESTFIAGRVKALLEASKETLAKYRELLNGVSLRTRLIGNINRYNLAIYGNPVYAPQGQVAQVRTKYTGATQLYPLEDFGKPNVDPRHLPRVGVYIKTFPPDIWIFESGHTAMWEQMFVIQTEQGQFGTEPDAINAFFSFYRFRPLGRNKYEADLSGGIDNWTSYDKLKGECTELAVELRSPSGNDKYIYKLYAFLDVDLVDTSNVTHHFPFGVINPASNASNPEVTFIICGKRIKSTDTGLFIGDIRDGQLVGFTKTHSTVEKTLEEVLYSEPCIFTVIVDGKEYGSIDYEEGTHKVFRSDDIVITATPNEGCKFGGWVLDGRGIPPDVNPIMFTMIHDRTLIAKFYKETTVYKVPIELVYCDECKGYENGVEVPPSADLIDEVHSDGSDTMILLPNTVQPQALLTANLSSVSIPSDATIESVIVEVTAQKSWYGIPAKLSFGLEIDATRYLSPEFDFPHDWFDTQRFEWTNNPHTLESWKVDEINNLKVVVANSYWGLPMYISTVTVWVKYVTA